MRDNMANNLELEIILTTLIILKTNEYFIYKLDSIESYLLIFLHWGYDDFRQLSQPYNTENINKRKGKYPLVMVRSIIPKVFMFKEVCNRFDFLKFISLITTDSDSWNSIIMSIPPTHIFLLEFSLVVIIMCKTRYLQILSLILFRNF